jgi:hypothetical protein
MQHESLRNLAGGRLSLGQHVAINDGQGRLMVEAIKKIYELIGSHFVVDARSQQFPKSR